MRIGTMKTRRSFIKAVLFGCAALALPIPKLVRKRLTVSDLLPVSFDAHVKENLPSVQLGLNTRNISVPVVWTEWDNDIIAREGDTAAVKLMSSLITNSIESCSELLGYGPIQFGCTAVEEVRMEHTNKRVYCMHVIGRKNA
jgi:hypothetical protein